MDNQVSAILSGFGYWVNQRTVIPFMQKYPQILKIVGVTNLLPGEYTEKVVPTFEQNGWAVPKWIQSVEESCNPEHYSEGNKPVAILVTTPNTFHYQEARTAIDAGYHVYVEKPVATYQDDLPGLVDLARQKNLFFVSTSQRRFEAPFQYLKNALMKREQFGNLRRIHCKMAVGLSPVKWRREKQLAGGGVLFDNGYHLLDIACWLLKAVGIQIPARLSGAVYIRSHEYPTQTEWPLDVETEALGYVTFPDNVLLSFDFSYNVPKNSIFEQIEIIDQANTRICLVRDQAIRTPLPATITHQLFNGELAGMELQHFEYGIRADAIRFAHEGQNMKPLMTFLTAIREGVENTPALKMANADASLSVWHLVRELYRLAEEAKN